MQPLRPLLPGGKSSEQQTVNPVALRVRMKAGREKPKSLGKMAGLSLA